MMSKNLFKALVKCYNKANASMKGNWMFASMEVIFVPAQGADINPRDRFYVSGANCLEAWGDNISPSEFTYGEYKALRKFLDSYGVKDKRVWEPSERPTSCTVKVQKEAFLTNGEYPHWTVRIKDFFL